MRTAPSLFAGLIAGAIGIQVFLLVFFAPVVIYGDDQVLLAWGWIAPIVGLPVAALSVAIAYSAVRSLLVRSLAAVSSRWAKVLSVGAAVLLVVGLSAYGMHTYGDVDVGWSEEVRLADGSSITVSRRALGNSFGQPGSRPQDWLPSEFVLDTPPSTLSPASSRPWRSPFRPIVLDRDASSGSWYLIAEPLTCAQWHTMGKPAPPHVFYVHGPGGWEQKPMDAKYIGQPANLLVAPRFIGEDALVSVEERRRRNESGPADSRPVVRASSKC